MQSESLQVFHVLFSKSANVFMPMERRIIIVQELPIRRPPFNFKAATLQSINLKRKIFPSHLKPGNHVKSLRMVMGLYRAHARVLLHFGLHILLIAMLAGPINSSQYQPCEPLKCGGGSSPEIRYPFYISGKGRDICGHSGFEIICQGTKTMYGHYSVESISYEEQSIKLVNQYVMDASCFVPRPSTFYPGNPILDPSHSFHPRLWFFYNCTDSFSFHYPTVPVNCTSKPIYNSFVALIHPNEPHYQEGGACQSSVAVPVELKEEISNQTIVDVDYKELLKEGFILKWDLLPGKSCNSCRQSEGQCGLSDERNFWCYCPDGTRHHKDCNSSNSGKVFRIMLDLLHGK
ncbi:hypothetical protein BT93_B2504 [Corymbia citriodora subsp. variegata]|nr:hypothetical protein BT93_B2504 [Corymbia citriodora subsp. variegata]